MKAILMSIQSKWLAKILDGEKTVELRKRFPKDYRGWVYLYCTKAKPYLSYNHYEGCFDLDKSYDKKLIHFNQTLINGKVVARVWVDNVKEIITFFQIFDKPKELNDFSVDHSAKWRMPIKAPITKAPPTWQYIYIEEETL